MLLIDASEHLTNSQDFSCVNSDVRCLAGGSTRRLCIISDRGERVQYRDSLSEGETDDES